MSTELLNIKVLPPTPLPAGTTNWTLATSTNRTRDHA
jgi:hypothetical protein